MYQLIDIKKELNIIQLKDKLFMYIYYIYKIVISCIITSCIISCLITCCIISCLITCCIISCTINCCLITSECCLTSLNCTNYICTIICCSIICCTIICCTNCLIKSYTLISSLSIILTTTCTTITTTTSSSTTKIQFEQQYLISYKYKKHSNNFVIDIIFLIIIFSSNLD
jgi:hypothetical protein